MTFFDYFLIIFTFSLCAFVNIMLITDIIKTSKNIRKYEKEIKILMEETVCPNCGSDGAIWDGRYALPDNKTVEAFKCIDCGAEWEVEV